MVTEGTDPVWDWYQGTLMADLAASDPGAVLDVLGDVLDAPNLDESAGRWGYATEAVLRTRDGDVAARMMYGGRQPWPTCWGSGHAAIGVADALRGHWAHRVTRVDSAMDWCGPGAWEALYGLCIALADARGLTVNQAGDWHRGVEGRTLYVGSKKSPVFLRLYEKGKQMGGDPDWVRVELVVRPQKDTRTQVASMSPRDVWGLSVWARALLVELGGVTVPRVVMRPAVAGDDRRALEVMLRQYGNVLTRLEARLGSDEAVGRFLMGRVRLHQGTITEAA